MTAILATGAAAAQPSCGQTAASATIAAVRDERTVIATDGREIRLAGLETIGDSAAGRTAAEALGALTVGRTLVLRQASDAPDRYGRTIAFVYPAADDRSVQAALLAAGQARFSGRAGGTACAAPLLAAERTAREARRGLWTDPNFAPLAAENLPGLAAERGRFALIEGKIVSVRESGATIYLNFGRNWTRGFSVTILKRQQRTFAAAGLEPKKLDGRRVRIRGWIEQRLGPVVAAEVPEQIEIVD